MTIRITKLRPLYFEVACHRCGCEFEFEPDDIRKNYIRGLEVVGCPECGVEITHPFQGRTKP